MSLYTGKGDGGTTKLFDTKKGERLSKASPTFECLGTLDELNALIGWCKVACPKKFRLIGRDVSEIVHDVQNTLFTIQAEVAGASKTVPETSVRDISILILAAEAALPPIKTFFVAGGTELAVRFDIARTVARRAERRVVTLHESGDRVVGEYSRSFMNRLSSLLYSLARLANEQAGVTEKPPEYKS